MKGPRAFSALFVAALMCVVSQARAQDADPCAGVDCSGHGICVPFEGSPACNCDPGFVPDSSGRLCETEGGAQPEQEQPLDEQPTEPEEPPASTEPTEPVEDPDVDVVEEQPPSELDPAVEVPPVEEPQVEPMVEEPLVEEPLVEEPMVEEPMVEEPPISIETTVPVTFDVQRGRRHISVAIGEERHECLTPCTLELPPGEARVGPPAGSWDSEVSFPVPEGPAVANILREQGRLRGAGIGLAAGGGGLMMVGLLVAVLVSPAISNTGFDAGDAAGIALVVPGTLAFVAGLVLLAVAPESYRVQLQAAQPSSEAAQEATQLPPLAGVSPLAF